MRNFGGLVAAGMMLGFAGSAWAQPAPAAPVAANPTAECAWRRTTPSGPPNFELQCKAGKDWTPVAGSVAADKGVLERANAGDIEAQWTVGLVTLAQSADAVAAENALTWLRRAADQGSLKAMLLIAQTYFYGAHVPSDDAQHQAWRRRAAEAGDTRSIWEILSELYGLRDASSLSAEARAEGRRWDVALAQSGAAPAPAGCYWTRESFSGRAGELTLFCDGMGVPMSGLYGPLTDQTVVKARAGDVAAMKLIARLHLANWRARQHVVYGAEWMRRAADAGDAEAMGALGGLYRLGRGVPQSDAEARRWFEAAAAKGDPAARRALNGTGQPPPFAPIILSGPMVPSPPRPQPPRDLDREAREAESARAKAAAGDPTAMAEIGRAYIDGKGVPKDLVEALRWCRAAADLRNAKGLVCLGRLFEGGLGVGKDRAEARRLYRQAADGGDTAAMVALGSSYRYLSPETDYRQCAIWWWLAADQGDVAAMEQLAGLYVGWDPEEAARWRAMAQRN